MYTTLHVHSEQNILTYAFFAIVLIHYMTNQFKGNTKVVSNKKPTQVVEGFKQIGILQQMSGDLVLPLFGKSTMPATTYHLPYYYGENTWNYYTVNDTNTIIPLEYNNQDCMSDSGCKELVDDTVLFISIFKDHFKVKIYKTMI